MYKVHILCTTPCVIYIYKQQIILFINSVKSVCHTFGGQTYFLIKFFIIMKSIENSNKGQPSLIFIGQAHFLINFFFIMKRIENLNNGRYIYYKYFVVTLKLTNYAENTSLISLWASFFVIFRGNPCIEAKYRQ